MVLQKKTQNLFQLYERSTRTVHLCTQLGVASVLGSTIENLMAFVQARYVHDAPFHLYNY